MNMFRARGEFTVTSGKTLYWRNRASSKREHYTKANRQNQDCAGLTVWPGRSAVHEVDPHPQGDKAADGKEGEEAKRDRGPIKPFLLLLRARGPSPGPCLRADRSLTAEWGRGG